MQYKKLIYSLITTICISSCIYSCSRTSNKPINTAPVTTPSNQPSMPNQPNKPISGNPNSPNLLSIEEIYAPVLYFDSQEKQPLTSVESYLGMGISLEARKGIGRYKVLKETIEPGDLYNNTKPVIKIDNDDYYLMLNTKDRISQYDEKVYTRKLVKSNYTYLQYWFFYSYNDIKDTGGISLIHKCGNHQADWEHISLKINNTLFQKAKTDSDYLKSIESIYFSQHNKGQHDERKYKKPADKGVTFEGTHIKAYPSRGTHATYFEPNSSPGYLLTNLLGMKLYDKTDGKGKVLRTQRVLQDLESSNWSKYGGKWGKISDDICNVAEWFSSASNDGPLGPLQQNSGIDWDRDKMLYEN